MSCSSLEKCMQDLSPPPKHVQTKKITKDSHSTSLRETTFFSCCRCWQCLKRCYLLHRNWEANFKRSIPGDLFSVTLTASLDYRKQQMTSEPNVIILSSWTLWLLECECHRSQGLEKVFAYEKRISVPNF